MREFIKADKIKFDNISDENKKLSRSIELLQTELKLTEEKLNGTVKDNNSNKMLLSKYESFIKKLGFTDVDNFISNFSNYTQSVSEVESKIKIQIKTEENNENLKKEKFDTKE